MQPRELDAGRRTVSTTSGEISFIDIGTGPAALFVHGVGTNAYLWRNVIGSLAGSRRCLAIDLPLHGQTPVAPGQDLSVAAMASVLEDFCDAVGLASIDLVANDTGGAVAQVFAARNSAGWRRSPSPTATPRATCRRTRSSRSSTWRPPAPSPRPWRP